MTEPNLATVKTTFDRLFAQAERSAQQLEDQLRIIDNKLQDQIPTHDEEERERLLELTLQLRVDALHTIDALLSLNSSYCQVIGIDSRNSDAQNFERLAHALGKDNISTMIKTLMRMIGDIEQAIHAQLRQQQEQRKLRRKLRKLLNEHEQEQLSEQEAKKEEYAKEFRHDVPHSKIESLAILFHHAQHMEAYFHHSIEQLTEAFHHYSGLPKYGVVFNHIATLEGPMTRFYLAAQHGLGIIQSIFSRSYQHLGIEAHPHLDLATQLRLQRRLQQRTNHLLMQQQRSLNMTKNNQHLLNQPTQKPPTATANFILNLERSAQLARTMKY